MVSLLVWKWKLLFSKNDRLLRNFTVSKNVEIKIELYFGIGPSAETRAPKLLFAECQNYKGSPGRVPILLTIRSSISPYNHGAPDQGVKHHLLPISTLWKSHFDALVSALEPSPLFLLCEIGKCSEKFAEKAWRNILAVAQFWFHLNSTCLPGILYSPAIIMILNLYIILSFSHLPLLSSIHSMQCIHCCSVVPTIYLAL